MRVRARSSLPLSADAALSDRPVYWEIGEGDDLILMALKPLSYGAFRAWDQYTQVVRLHLTNDMSVTLDQAIKMFAEQEENEADDDDDEVLLPTFQQLLQVFTHHLGSHEILHLSDFLLIISEAADPQECDAVLLRWGKDRGRGWRKPNAVELDRAERETALLDYMAWEADPESVIALLSEVRGAMLSVKKKLQRRPEVQEDFDRPLQSLWSTLHELQDSTRSAP